MTRTHKDRKYHFLDPRWRRMGDRIGRFCKDWWGSERAKVRDTLKKGEEPDPTRTRSSVKWDIL